VTKYIIQVTEKNVFASLWLQFYDMSMAQWEHYDDYYIDLHISFQQILEPKFLPNLIHFENNLFSNTLILLAKFKIFNSKQFESANKSIYNWIWKSSWFRSKTWQKQNNPVLVSVFKENIELKFLSELVTIWINYKVFKIIILKSFNRALISNCFYFNWFFKTIIFNCYYFWDNSYYKCQFFFFSKISWFFVMILMW
jgi:hypothetical protein